MRKVFSSLVIPTIGMVLASPVALGASTPSAVNVVGALTAGVTGETETTWIILPTNNHNGMHIRSMTMACYNNTAAEIVFPKGREEQIAICNPQITIDAKVIQGTSNGPYDFYLPPGDGLLLYVGPVGYTGGNQIVINYDPN